MSSPTPSTYSNSSDHFLREFPVVGKKNIRAHLPYFKWRDDVTNMLLESVVLEKHNFEKPTAKIYYVNLIKKYPKLSSLDWLKMKTKLHHLKLMYLKAVKWESENSTDLSEDEIKKNILNICPHWDSCHQIFQHKIKKTIVVSDKSDTSVDSLEFSLNEYKHPKRPQVFIVDDKINRKNFERDSKQKKVVSIIDGRGSGSLNNLDVIQNATENYHPPFENHFVINPEKSISNKFLEECQGEPDLELREKLNANREIEKNKFYIQKEFLLLENRKLKLEESKLELERHKIDIDFKLKQEQIASEERIRKYEIEFKYKT